MDPSLRLSCEELLELPYFQEDGGGSWGREGERPGRRHDKGTRRRQAGVSSRGCLSLALSLSLSLSITLSLTQYHSLTLSLTHSLIVSLSAYPQV